MSLTTFETKEKDTDTAKRLAGKPWHTLSKEDTVKVIVLQATTGLLGRYRREPRADQGFVFCTVGIYVGP